MRTLGVSVGRASFLLALLVGLRLGPARAGEAPAPSVEKARRALRTHVAAQVRKGKKKHVLLAVAGQNMRVRVQGLLDDDGEAAEGLIVSALGSRFTVAWEDVSDAQLYGVARKYLGDDATARQHIELAVLAESVGHEERFEEHLVAAVELDGLLAALADGLRGVPAAGPGAAGPAGRSAAGGTATARPEPGGLTVPLTVYETLGITRRKEPVTSGVPLPFGKLRDPRRLMMTDASGREIPVQVTVLSRHKDGSLRWVLVDFLGSCPANGQARYYLREGAPNSPRTLAISRSGGQVVFDTGVAKIEIPLTSGALISRAYADSDRDGSYASDEAVIVGGGRNGIVVGDGRPSGAIGGATAEIEEQGPHKAVVKVHGVCDQSSGLEYTARICVWGGSGIVKIYLTIENPNAINPKGGDLDPAGNWWKGMGPLGGATNSIIFKDLSLVFHVPPKHGRWSLLGDAEGRVSSGSGAAGDIYQDSSGGEHWDHPNSEGTTFRGWRGSIGQGKRAIGAGDLSGAGGGLGVGVRWFWQNFPKAISLKEGEARLGLWPSEWKGRPHEIRAGEHKTHEILLVLHGPGAGGERAVRTVQALNEPLRAFAPSRYYLGLTFVCPEALPAGHPAANSYDAMVRAQFEGGRNFFKMQEDYDAYGWMDFGDAVADCEFVGGRVAYNAYGNMEYNISMAFLFQCIRFLDADPKLAMLLWHLHERAARHQADIDIYHARKGPYPEHWGGMYRHNEHNLDIKGNKHRGSMADYQHQWSEGIAANYFFTGYRKCLEDALGMADQGIARFGKGRQAQCFVGDDRRYGSQLTSTLEAWLATRDKKYEDHLTAILDAAPHDRVRRTCSTQKAWAVGIMYGMGVLRMCNDYALAGEKPPQALLDSLRAMCDGMLKGVDSTYQCYRGRCIDTLMGGYRYLGDEKYRAAAVKAFKSWPDRRYNHNKDMGGKIFGGCLVPYVESGGRPPSPGLFDRVFGRR